MAVEVDISKERQNLLVGAVLTILGAVPYIGFILAIIGIVLMYNGLKGYEEKLGLKGPKKNFLKSVIIGIVGTLLIIGVVLAVFGALSPGGGSWESPNYQHSSDDTVVSAIALTVLGLWVVLVASMYYSVKAFCELGKFFGVGEFETYKKLAYFTYLLFPLWVIIPVIGWLILGVLGIITFVFLLLGITKLPERWTKENDLQKLAGTDTVIY